MQATPTVEDDESFVRTHRVHWWKEALIVVAFYAVYSWTRNQFGSAIIAKDGVPEQAFHNAERIIRLERLIGLYHEETIQEMFLASRWLIKLMNMYYGSAHFIVTIAVFVVLFWKRPGVFPQWRNTLAFMTALAIVGFALFPVMPPRLLDEPCPRQLAGAYGGACIESRYRPEGGGFGYVDTLADYGGGPWSFNSEGMANISNQYAAMPSLHIGWSTWCAIGVWPLLRRRWQRVAVFAYPMLTLFCIIVTANHYWIDGLGGLVVFAVAALLGWGVHKWNQERLERAFERHLAHRLRPVVPLDDDSYGGLDADRSAASGRPE
jgi:membrane-associated phospholipid phosphatase